jgi:antitoxin ParD1/3/4
MPPVNAYYGIPYHTGVSPQPFRSIARIAIFRFFHQDEGKRDVPMDVSISLTEAAARFVEAKVSSGRYGLSSEVFREALLLMETSEREDAEKLQLLRRAWREDIDSGDAGEMDFATLKRETRVRLAASKV